MSSGSASPGPAKVASAEAAAFRRLTRAWRWWCLACLAGLGAASALLWPAIGADLARWLIPNLLVSAGILAFVRSRLPLNRRSPDGPLLRDLGAGNHWTISRGVLIGQLPGYLFLPWPDGPQAWLPTLTFTIALVGDFVDGYLARRASAVTLLGEALDIEFDGTGLLAATALAVHYGQLPMIYLLTVGMARYTYLLAAWVAKRAGRRLRALPPSTTRRGLAGVTMELAAAALWPIVPPVMMTLAGAIVGIPFLAGFVRDGLVHLGFLDPELPAYSSARRAVVRVFTVILPPILRAILLLLLAPPLGAAARSFGALATLARHTGAEPTLYIAGAVLCALSISLALVVLGVAGRAGAVVLIVVYGLTLAATGLSAAGVAAWGCAFAIFLLGTGAGSIWQPERALYLRRAGESG